MSTIFSAAGCARLLIREKCNELMVENPFSEISWFSVSVVLVNCMFDSMSLSMPSKTLPQASNMASKPAFYAAENTQKRH